MRDTDLIPEIADWNDGRGISVESWVSCVGNFELAIGFLRLFWPTFEERDGCLLRAGYSEQCYQEFLKHTNGDRTAIEAVLNHVHITDLFCDPKLNPTEDQVVHIGRLLKKMWTAKLAHEFPSLNVSVDFRETEIECLVDYQVTVVINRKVA